ncbi:leucine-rich repeat extensin-like protein 3 [Carex rostrata]
MNKCMGECLISRIPFLLAILFLASAFSGDHGIAGVTASNIRHSHRRHLLSDYQFANPHLKDAYIALQALKHAIISDPYNMTASWVGPDVCNYNRVFCAPAPYDPYLTVVASIDLNHGDIAGYLPEELGLLVDLSVLHINSNRFCCTLPSKFDQLKLLHELDLSNNKLSGKFPEVLLRLPSLKYLDIRYNEFEGSVPKELFDLPLDAIFINSNRFKFEIPDNIGNSPVSVIVLANNKFSGCLPSGIANMSNTLNEIILMNNGLNSCIPSEFGLLKSLTVLDLSLNNLAGPLPDQFGSLEKIEVLNLAHNRITGSTPDSICSLPKLKDLNLSYNYLTSESSSCLHLSSYADELNCIQGRPHQKSEGECKAALSNQVNCDSFKCKKCPSEVSPEDRYLSPPPPPTSEVSPEDRYLSPPPPPLVIPVWTYGSPPPPSQ